MPLIHKTLWLVKEAVWWWWWGGVKILWPYKMTPPPNCRIQDVTSLALFVHLSGLFISFYSMPLIHKTLWLVKEAVVGGGVGGGGGGQNIMAIIN